MHADTGGDPEQAIERDAAELEDRIDRLDGHIAQAKNLAEERAREAGKEEGATGDVVGDWEGEEVDSVRGDDPSGANREEDR